MLKQSPSGIPYVDWGGEGPTLHIAHANGFPPATYTHLAERLVSQHRVLGMECRALWPGQQPADLRHWRQFGQDLTQFLRDLDLGRVTLCGHSLGAVVSLYCAAANPELVGQLILIDPVILPPWIALLWAAAMPLGLGSRSPLASGARRRRTEWPNRSTALRAYRTAPAFRLWRPPFLQDYVDSAFEDTAQGTVRLRYSAEWESRVFATAPPDVWLQLPKLRDKEVLVIRGQSSNTFRPDALRWMRRLLPAATYLEIRDADHFVPMSQPEATAKCIQESLATQS